MPVRNVLFLLATTIGCLAVWVNRDQERPGRRFNEFLAIVADLHLEEVDVEELLDAAVEGAVSRLDEHSAFIRGAERDTDGSGSAGKPVGEAHPTPEAVREESVRGDRRRGDGSWDWFVEDEPGVAWIRITSFGEGTIADFDAAIAEIAAASPPTGVLLDLRGNQGGLLAGAVEMCDRFLDDGVIVVTRRRQDGGGPPRDVRRAAPGTRLDGVPLAVLVDGLTASTAEVVAACLQDNGRARVFGSRTFGKGTVQTVLPLGGTGLLSLTTAEFLRPSGGRIHRAEAAGDDAEWGVVPDVGCAVAPSLAALDELHHWRRQRDITAPVVATLVKGPRPRRLPREIDQVLALALEALRPEARAASAAATNFSREKEAAGHADESPSAGD